eukprot:6272420-Prymnesium_polylepis.1
MRCVISASLAIASSAAYVRPGAALVHRRSRTDARPPMAVDYGTLGTLPRSFGREAGEWVLAGEVPQQSRDGWEVATFAGGCFWGTELHYMRLDGVVSTCVGYTQGRVRQPMYTDVCRGITGHTEACQLIFDPDK